MGIKVTSKAGGLHAARGALRAPAFLWKWVVDTV